MEKVTRQGKLCLVSTCSAVQWQTWTICAPDESCLSPQSVADSSTHLLIIQHFVSLLFSILYLPSPALILFALVIWKSQREQFPSSSTVFFLLHKRVIFFVRPANSVRRKSELSFLFCSLLENTFFLSLRESPLSVHVRSRDYTDV